MERMRPVAALLIVATLGFPALARADSLAHWSSVAPARAPFNYPGRSRLAVAQQGQVLLNDRSRSIDGGRSWQPLTLPEGRTPAFFQSSSNASDLYASLDYGGPLYFSGDAGATWRLVSPRIAVGNDPVDYLVPVGPQPGLLFGQFPESCLTGVCYGVGLARSRDGGATWSRIESGGLEGQRIFDLTTAPSDARQLYVRAEPGGFFRSSDGGDHWSAVSKIAFDGSEALPGYDMPLAVDVRDPLTIYGCKGKAWISRDGGASWVRGGDCSFGSTLFNDPVDAGRVFLVGSSGEILESRDGAISWRQVAAQSDVDGFRPRMVANGQARAFYATGSSSIQSVTVGAVDLVIGVDVWWYPAEPGWGVSLIQKGRQIVAVWYRYGAGGKATWDIVPGGSWSDAKTFNGTMYSTRGPNFFDPPFDPSRVTTTERGRMTLHFIDSDTADLSIVYDGRLFSRRIVRQQYGRPSSTAFIGGGDLWWNPLQSGWGLAIHQQQATIFKTLFAYDGAGDPTWWVMPDAESADFLATTGPPPEGFDPSLVRASRLGTASVSFVGLETVFSVTLTQSALPSIPPKIVSVPIQREPF
jgi:photosystem II stability/assembly factor-like uncharacterized protein